jgi:hypothetical protein
MSDSNETEHLKSPEVKEIFEDIDKFSIWDSTREENIKILGENSQGYKVMHLRSARNYLWYYNLFMYLNMFFAPLATLFSAIGMILNPSNAPILFPLLATITSFFATIAATIVKNSSFEEKSSSHKKSVSGYTSLESNVRRQLGIPRNYRVNPLAYSKWLTKSYDDLTLASPLIPLKISDKYESEAKTMGISVPTKLSPIININTNYEIQKLSELQNRTVIDINSNGSESSVGEETLEGGQQVKRRKNFTHYPDLNRYSDGMMDYEMKRLIGFDH